MAKKYYVTCAQECWICEGEGQVINPLWAECLNETSDDISRSETIGWFNRNVQNTYYSYDELPPLTLMCSTCNGNGELRYEVDMLDALEDNIEFIEGLI